MIQPSYITVPFCVLDLTLRVCRLYYAARRIPKRADMQSRSSSVSSLLIPNIDHSPSIIASCYMSP